MAEEQTQAKPEPSVKERLDVIEAELRRINTNVDFIYKKLKDHSHLGDRVVFFDS